MNQIFERLLPDEELRPLLEAQQSIRFDGLVGELEKIQKQVDRLGFGDSYVVSSTKEPPENWVKLTPRPGYKVDTEPSHGLSKPSLAERPSSALSPKGEQKKYSSS